ncbi:MAG: hypothetical protein JKY67_17390 [Pseudomonadales bacterium]|nr:hypothetical protein [Pseudomonadales bacterium]
MDKKRMRPQFSIKGSMPFGYTLRWRCLIYLILLSQWSVADPIRIGGFFSTGITDANKDNTVLLNNQIENKTNYLADTVFGLQLDTRLTKETRFSAQLTAQDKNNSFDLAAEWLFISQQLSTSVELRAGRLRLPIYFISETINVGQSYDWVRPPLEVYALTGGLTNYNGFSTLYKYNFYASTIEAEIYLGQAKDSLRVKNQSLNVDTDHFYGGQITYIADRVIARASRIQTSATADFLDLGITIDSSAEISVVGFNYTQGNWSGLMEYGILETEDDGDTSAYYLSLHYTVDRLVPVVTFGSSRTNPDATSPTIKGSSVSLGVRYNFSERSSMKLQALKGEVLDGPSLVVLPGISGFDDEVTMYSATLNLIF